MALLWLMVLVLSEVLPTQGSLYAATAEKELQQYKYRNNILHEILSQEGCLTGQARRPKRASADNSTVQTQLEVEIKFYDDLTAELVRCRQSREDRKAANQSTTSTASSPSTTATAGTTTITPVVVTDGVNLALGMYTFQVRFRRTESVRVTYRTTPHKCPMYAYQVGGGGD